MIKKGKNEKPKNLTDYEKLVAQIAAQFMIASYQALGKNEEEVSCTEVLGESLIDAVDVVEGVLEITRDEKG